MQFKAIDMATETLGIEDISGVINTPGFSMIMDRMTDGVLIIDTNGIVRAINSTAVHMNDVKKNQVVGETLENLFSTSALEWGDLPEQSGARQKREFIASSEDGRSILVSLRYLRDSVGKVGLTLIFMRDLQVFDHMRRTAAGISGGNVFKFLADRDVGPDFEAQRNLSPDVERMLLRGTRALHQGARLLLVGESGSGKTELAKYLHRSIGTPEEAFIHVNCGAIPESLFESEMFGYEKGAFTGALQTGKRGLIEAAEGGTLFLDEVGEIPLSSQAKLLKFLEDGIVQRIGGRSGKKINTRVISATNRDLWNLVSEKKFRHDLYYRLAVITLEVTPLREQPKLIKHLVDHFVNAANRMRKPHLTVSEECRAALVTYPFPGNIRELHNLVQHLSVAADDEANLMHLPMHVREPDSRGEQETVTPISREKDGGSLDSHKAEGPRPLKEQVRAFERSLIDNAINRLGSKRKAAKALGVDIGTIVRKTQEEEKRT